MISRPKLNIFIGVVFGLIAGFALGVLFGSPADEYKTNSGNAAGNIARIARQRVESGQTIQPEAAAASDLISMVDMMSSKMSELLYLIDMSESAAAGIPEMDNSLTGLKSLREDAEHAASLAESAKSDDGSFRDLSLDFYYLDGHTFCIKQFVQDAKQYLENNAAGHEDLAKVCGRWAKYCADAALSRGDTADYVFWQGEIN